MYRIPKPLDERENHNYEENNGATRPTGVNLRSLEQEHKVYRREPPDTTLKQFSSPL